MESIKINNELIINIPEGYSYSQNTKEIGGERILSVVKNDSNWDVDYSLSEPFSAPECLLISIAQSYEEINPFALMKMLGMKIAISESGIRENLKEFFVSMMSSMAYKNIDVIRNDSKMLFIYGTNHGNDHYIGIAAGKHLYIGQIWVNEIEDEEGIERRAKEICEWITPIEKKHSSKASASRGNECEKLFFGSYPQTEKKASDPIEWLILEKTEERMLLITKDIIALQPFNYAYRNQWSDSVLRSWLNKEFFEQAFSKEEQGKILQIQVDECNPTLSDKVFILSEEEILKYLSKPKARIANRSVLAQEQYKDSYLAYFGGTEGDYWLRTGAKRSDFVKYVGETGKIYASGYFVINEKCGVRPAIWVKE